MKKKFPSREKLLSGDYKSTSPIPKTPKQRQMWKRAVAITVKESGKSSEKEIPYGLATTIFKNARKAGKVPKKSDVTNAKRSPAVARYKK